MSRSSILLLAVIVFGMACTFDPRRRQAEHEVVRYMTSAEPGYRPGRFIEFFEQYPRDGRDISEFLHADALVTFSLSHDYEAGGRSCRMTYFHFDKSMHLLGHMTADEMIALTMNTPAMQRFLQAPDSARKVMR